MSVYSEAVVAQIELAEWLSSAQYRLLSGRKSNETFRTLTLMVAAADPFTVTDDLLGVIEASSRSLDDWILHDDDPIVPRGWLWLPRPVEVAEGRPAIKALVWAWTGDRLIVLPFIGIEHFTEPPPNWPKHVTVTPDYMFSWHSGVPISRVEVHETHEERRGRDHIEGTLRFLAATMAFARQRVVSIEPERLPRSIRRRESRAVERSPDAVNVIKLRVEERRNERADEHRTVDWSCQWLVSGYWRRVNSATSDRRIWVAPHRRGPADKPLRATARVFRIVR